MNRYSFYDHLKAYTAAPPDVLRVDEKNLREYTVLNCCGLVITTNHKSGLYLPPDDRRHYVAWSDLTKDDFEDNYWTGLWHWYNRGGDGRVAAYLAEYDPTEFDPKAPPPKTAAFLDIVDANRAPEESDLADVLERRSTLDQRSHGAAARAAAGPQNAAQALFAQRERTELCGCNRS